MPNGLQIFNQALIGTQYSSPILLPDDAGEVGLIIDHPAGVTTAYTFEVTNNDFGEILNGTARWAPVDDVTIGSKSAAEVFSKVVPARPFSKLRVKTVTSVGSALGRIWSSVVKGVGTVSGGGGGGGVTAHSGLTGLATGNDHTQYVLGSAMAAYLAPYFVKASDTISDGNHGNRSGGTLHAPASGAAAGFMSAADKTKLDGVAAAKYYAEQTLGSAQATIVFGALNGDLHKRYRIRGYGLGDTAGTMGLQFNNNATVPTYAAMVYSGAGVTHQGTHLLAFYSTNCHVSFEIIVECATLANLKRGGRALCTVASSGGAWDNTICSFRWNNTTDNITSLTLAGGAGCFMAGFRACIEEVL